MSVRRRLMWSIAVVLCAVSIQSCRRFIKASEVPCRSSADCSASERCWLHPYTVVCETEPDANPSRGTCLPSECLVAGETDVRREKRPVLRLRTVSFENCVCGGLVAVPGEDSPLHQCIDDALLRKGMDPEKTCGEGWRLADFATHDGGARSLTLPRDLKD